MLDMGMKNQLSKYTIEYHVTSTTVTGHTQQRYIQHKNIYQMYDIIVSLKLQTSYHA